MQVSPTRAGCISDLLAAGFTDSFAFYPEVPHKYSWCRTALLPETNIGWRIDYFCCSDAPNSTDISDTRSSHGLRHCPVLLKLSTQAGLKHPFSASEKTVQHMGELALISKIRHWLGPVSPPSPYGIGDDCALIKTSSEQEVISCDSLKGIHLMRHWGLQMPAAS